MTSSEKGPYRTVDLASSNDADLVTDHDEMQCVACGRTVKSGEGCPHDGWQHAVCCAATQAALAHDGRTYMDNPPACGADPNWRWGFLPCGCHNDGYGRHGR